MIINKSETIPQMPHKTAVAKFRLLTEHNYLAKHLHKIGIYTSPNRPPCNSEEKMIEHLQTCKALPSGSITEKYWSAQVLMTSLPNAKHLDNNNSFFFKLLFPLGIWR